MNAILKKLIVARELAENGIDFSARMGASCPWCSKKAKIYSTRPWEDNTRIRYHRCINDKCPMATMGISIKSIEVD